MNKYLKMFMEWGGSPVLLGITTILISLTTMKGISFVGIFILLIGEVIYGYNNFMMGSVWSANIEKKDTLIKKGLFKYIRHPLYLGYLVGNFGFGFMFKSWQAFVFNLIVQVPYIYVRSKMEEELLSKTLKGYKKYMKETGMFFPKL